MEIPAAKQSPGRGRAPCSSPVPSQHRAHTGHRDSTCSAPSVTHLVPSAPSSLKEKPGFVSQHKAQTSCAMRSAAHGLLQPWLNPKKQLHCRKAELTFLFPEGRAAASEAARTLGWLRTGGSNKLGQAGCKAMALV